MQKLLRKPSARGNGDQSRIANFTDVRPAAHTVAPAAPHGIDVSAAIKRRPLLAILPLLLSLAIGIPYAMSKKTPEFHSEATVYVAPTYLKNLQGDRDQVQIAYSTLVNQQILTIRRYDILATSINRLEKQGIHWRNPGEAEATAVARLSQQLDVQHIPDSYEVLVGMNGNKRAVLAPIVNTVVNTYLEKGELEDQAGRTDRLNALVAEQLRIQTVLRGKLDQQARLSQDLMAVDVNKGASADDALISAARQAREEARRKRIEAEAQIAILASTPASGKMPLTVLAEEAATSDPDLRALMNTLVQRRLDLQTRIQGLTPEHPFRQETEKEIATIDAQLTDRPQQSVAAASARVLAKLRAEVDRTRLLETEFDKEVQEAGSKVQGIAQKVQLAQGLGAEIERLRKSENTLSSGIDDSTLDSGGRGYLHVFSPAQAPLEPTKTNFSKLLAEALAVGLLLSLILCVGMDMIDQRILSPSEIRRSVGFPPVGLVLEPSEQTAAFAGEQFCRLVNGIQRGITAEAAKSVVLTPLKPRFGAGSLINDIGRALVARGLKTVIIDGNLGFGEESTAVTIVDPVNLSASLNPGLNPSAGAQEPDHHPVPRIGPGSATELGRVVMTGPVSSMLEELKREYDVVLIDAPVLRLSAEAEFLAGIADITLVLVESGQTTRKELIQGAALLGRVGAPSVGVIMTGVRLRKAGAELSRDFEEFSSLSWTTADETVM